MRLRLRSFLLTSALTFAPALASATTISGLYVDGGSGYNNVQDQHVHANSSANGDAVPKFSVNHGTGFAGFGAVGYGFGNGLRVEAEGLYNFSHDDYASSERYTSYEEHTSIEKNPAWKAHQVDQTGKEGTSSYFGGYTHVQDTTQIPCKDLIDGWTGLNYGIKNFLGWWNGKRPVASANNPNPIFGLPNGEFSPFSPDVPIGNPNTNGYGYTTTASSQWNYVPFDVKNYNNAPLTSTTSICYLVNYNGQNSNYLGNAVNDMNAGSTLASTYASYGFSPENMWQSTNGDIFGLPPSTGFNGTNADPGYYYYVHISNGGNDILTYKGYAPVWKGHPYTPQYISATHVTAITHITAMNHEGTDESWGGFANVLYDFDLERLFGLKSIATPFIGGGAGYLWQR
ncbi:MAG: hypothetical protein II846_05965, partial [Acetobacter sp.]|nr:hypothetical protein [Acetobacter sp.]